MYKHKEFVKEYLKKKTTFKYVTIKEAWIWDECCITILEESNTILTTEQPYQYNSSGDFGFKITSLYLG